MPWHQTDTNRQQTTTTTRRNKHLIITSKRRFDVIITCLLRCVFARLVPWECHQCHFDEIIVISYTSSCHIGSFRSTSGENFSKMTFLFSDCATLVSRYFLLISPWTKWPPFHRRHFQMYFHELKFFYFDLNFKCTLLPLVFLSHSIALWRTTEYSSVDCIWQIEQHFLTQNNIIKSLIYGWLF